MTTWTKDGKDYVMVPGIAPTSCKGCAFFYPGSPDRCVRDNDEHHGCVTPPTNDCIWVDATPENVAIAVAHRMTR